jgi:hypothetical protein
VNFFRGCSSRTNDRLAMPTRRSAIFRLRPHRRFRAACDPLLALLPDGVPEAG